LRRTVLGFWQELALLTTRISAVALLTQPWKTPLRSGTPVSA
jgi:hypothetical protein